VTDKLKALAVAFGRSFKFVSFLFWIFILDGIISFFFGMESSLAKFGLAPRSAMGLLGIITMPFLHANILHLLCNSISLWIMLIVLYLEFDDKFHMPDVMFKIIITSGILIWFFARGGGAIHIGASALVYGLTTYTFLAGFYHKNATLIAFSIALLFFNGPGLLLGVLPIDAVVSWEGHLFGAIAGLIVASSEQAKSRTGERV